MWNNSPVQRQPCTTPMQPRVIGEPTPFVLLGSLLQAYKVHALALGRFVP